MLLDPQVLCEGGGDPSTAESGFVSVSSREPGGPDAAPHHPAPGGRPAGVRAADPAGGRGGEGGLGARAPAQGLGLAAAALHTHAYGLPARQ